MNKIKENKTQKSIDEVLLNKIDIKQFWAIHRT